MGRAMIIITSGLLIALGIFNISTSQQGLSLTQKTVNNADYIMAKNIAHTAIQIAMQHINEDDEWAERHDKNNPKFTGPWEIVIDNRPVTLFTEYAKHPDYWEPDTLRLISNAQHKSITAEVISLYYKQPFSSLVPTFEGALSLPGSFNHFNIDGNAHSMSGLAPSHTECEDKPAVIVRSQDDKDRLPSDHFNVEGAPTGVAVNPDLSYEPTDELIERLWNSGNAVSVTSDFSDPLGSAENPGVFFIDTETVRLTGNQSEGFGIMVIRSGGYMEYEGGLDIRGQFEFNGLVIFENAFDFDGRGTPTINGTVMAGNTQGLDGTIDVDLGGNIHLQYDCEAENYARMAAADAVKQNKYTRRVTTEGVNYSSY